MRLGRLLVVVAALSGGLLVVDAPSVSAQRGVAITVPSVETIAELVTSHQTADAMSPECPHGWESWTCGGEYFEVLWYPQGGSRDPVVFAYGYPASHAGPGKAGGACPPPEASPNGGYYYRAHYHQTLTRPWGGTTVTHNDDRYAPLWNDPPVWIRGCDRGEMT